MAMQPFQNEYFTCKSLTAKILPENSPYLLESTDFVQYKVQNVRCGTTFVSSCVCCCQMRTGNQRV